MLSLTFKFICSFYDRFISQRSHKKAEIEKDIFEISSPSLSTPQELKCNVSGTVTKLNTFESYGLIDDVIYFNLDIVCGQDDIKIGDNVTVHAVRDNFHHGWKATIVQLVREEWMNENAVPLVEVDATKASTDLEPKTIEGKVTDSYSTFGLLNNTYRFEFQDCETSFRPMIGDVIVATIKNNTILNWKPKMQEKIDGVITVREMDFGVVNDSVIFFFATCCCKVPVICGQTVLASVVECCQQAFNLRAYELFPTQNADEKTAKPCVDDHPALIITDNFDFQSVFITEEKTLPLTLKNESASPLKFLGCKFQHCNKFLPFACKSDSNDAVFLPPGTEITLSVSCKPCSLGYHQNVLMLEFEDFVVSRSVSVFATDPMQQMINPIIPYTRPKSKSKSESCHENLTIIPGEKTFIPKANFKGFKPNYNIPQKLWQIFRESTNLSRDLSILTQNLDLHNYTKKFSCLLHLEEIAIVNHLRQFDMTEVILSKKGEFLSLAVPGLAEGRPSLMLGDKALLTPPNNNTNIAFEGVIHDVQKDDILLRFSENFHQTYDGETYNVFFRISRSNMKRMHEGMRMVMQGNNAIIFPRDSSRKQSCKIALQSINWQNKKLNPKQKTAVHKVIEGYCPPHPHIIFGPPGTGKTATVVEAILQIFLDPKPARMLVCTPSNSAADLITLKLIESKIVNSNQLVRLNSFQRSPDNIPEAIRSFCKDKHSVMEIINYPIIICTCSTSGILQDIELPYNHFSHLFVDEAGQLTEPNIMVPMSLIVRNKLVSIVLAGDPKQLGSVLLSHIAAAHGLQLSYLERILNYPLYTRGNGIFNGNYVTLLKECYRCHPAILCYPSRMFYYSSVVNSSEGTWSSLENCHFLPKKGFPVVFDGIIGEECREENSPSWFNSSEVVKVCQYLKNLYEEGLTAEEVGIISPYKKQVEKLRLLVNAFGLELCKIGSVEEFQGQERRAIIISMVRSNKDFLNVDFIHNLGFLNNPKRFNVAVTRAKELLIIVGNPHTLSQDPTWGGFINYCLINGGYTGCHILPTDLECRERFLGFNERAF